MSEGDFAVAERARMVALIEQRTNDLTEALAALEALLVAETNDAPVLLGMTRIERQMAARANAKAILAKHVRGGG